MTAPKWAPREEISNQWSGGADAGLCLTALDFSLDGRCLAAAGMEANNRTVIMVWSIEGLEGGRLPRLLLRSSSSHHTQCLRWDPDHPERLMACGRCSIRSYRYKVWPGALDSPRPLSHSGACKALLHLQLQL